MNESPGAVQARRKFFHQPGMLGLVFLDYLQSLRKSTVSLFSVCYALQNRRFLLPPVENVPDFGRGFDECLQSYLERDLEHKGRIASQPHAGGRIGAKCLGDEIQSWL